MSPEADVTLLVLLGLRLKGFAAADGVAEVVGLPPEELEQALPAYRERGWVQYREGRMTGWSLTPSGRDEGERRLAFELEAMGRRPEVRGCYGEFLALNGAMLAICTDWQMLDPDTLNDHRDPAHDAAVIERLIRLHGEVRPICEQLGRALPRLVAYGERLGAALSRVRAGDHDWFTSVRLPSYHTVWFELHENLLATLGIDRAAEAG